MWPQAYDALISHWRLLLELSVALLMKLWLKKNASRMRRELSRQKSWQYELSVRARAEHTSEINETIRTMSVAYASEEPPTLDDLLSSAERDWSLRSSEPPSRKTPEESYNRPLRSSIPPPPPRKK